MPRHTIQKFNDWGYTEAAQTGILFGLPLERAAQADRVNA
jgi:hypothetical protein